MAESGGGAENVKKISAPDREERLRLLRDRQAEERLRRLEEIKKQALETQQLRDQKEAERRKRMDELRLKENERRSQVECRKKMINEAEQDRREAILRKNEERDARCDAKRRNEKSSIVFAFGSSTPRLLETYDSVHASYWGPRRATSTANLRLFPAAAAPVNNDALNGASRRPSDREQDAKKRAASAGGLCRTPADKMSCSMYEVLHWCSPPSPNAPTTVPPGTFADVEDGWGAARVGRRKTDLMPTTPSPRDPSSRPGSGSRSLARTPGDVTPSASRPGSVMSQSSILSSSTLNPRLRSAPRRPRPSSIHITGMTKDKTPTEDDKKEEKTKLALATSSTIKKQNQQKNEEIKKLQQNKDKPKLSAAAVAPEILKSISKTEKTVKKNSVIVSKKVENESITISSGEVLKKDDNVCNVNGKDLTPPEKIDKTVEKIPPDEIITTTVGGMATPESVATITEKNNGTTIANENLPTPLVIKSEANVDTEEPDVTNGLLVDIVTDSSTDHVLPTHHFSGNPVATVNALFNSDVVMTEQPDADNSTLVDTQESKFASPVLDATSQSDSDPSDITSKGNVMTRSRITTEEEAKAVLAERRRQAREAVEREAEAERQRLAREEAELRLAEEEQLRMIEEARKLEEQRLMLAIQEAQKKEEEEKERRRLEEQARLEKEEADRLAREEAERQRQELAERLKKEEEERQARRKRVEAIMKRTRNATSANSKSGEDGEKGEQDGAEHEKDESKGAIEAFLHGERLSADISLSNCNGNGNGNGQASHKPQLSNINEESHSNGMSPAGAIHEDCVNSNPPSLTTPLIAFQGKSKDMPMPADFLA